MPFEKGNQIQKKKKGMKYAKTQAWENIVGWLVGEGGHKFREKIVSLSDGGELTKEEKEFIVHYKDLLEYHQPKLSRSDVDLKSGGEKITGFTYATPDAANNKANGKAA